MKDKRKSVLIKATVLFAFCLMTAVNAMAQGGRINGVTTAALSDKYPNLFVPAGLTFAIWGLIYLLLLLFSLYQLGIFGIQAQEGRENLLPYARGTFIFTSFANIGWIFAWHYGFLPVSLVLMLLLLIALLLLCRRLNALARRKILNRREIFFLRLPFSVYFGWITIASIANVTACLVAAGWDRFGASESLWTIVMIGIAAMIASACVILGRDVAYGMVVLWALAGILLRHVSSASFAGMYPEVMVASSIGAVTVALAVGYVLFVAGRNSASKSSGDEPPANAV